MLDWCFPWILTHSVYSKPHLFTSTVALFHEPRKWRPDLDSAGFVALVGRIGVEEEMCVFVQAWVWLCLVLPAGEGMQIRMARIGERASAHRNSYTGEAEAGEL
jgi:hypothetical protein